jgi:hypothetical protein
MNSNRKAHLRFSKILVVAGVLAISAGAQAATLTSGPLRMNPEDDYYCGAVNVGSKDIAVDISITISGSNPGSGASQSCSPLAPNTACTALNTAGGANYRFCKVTTSSKKTTKASFCNITTNVCIPVE